MSYDEQRISDQIDGGLHKMKEMGKKQTAMELVYDKIAPYLTNGKELLAVDVLTVIQEIGMPLEREQIEDAFNKGYDDHEYNNTEVKFGADPDVYYTQTFTSSIRETNNK